MIEEYISVNMLLLPVSDPYFMTRYSIYNDFRYMLFHYSDRDENETKPIKSDNNTIIWHIHMYDEVQLIDMVFLVDVLVDI